MQTSTKPQELPDGGKPKREGSKGNQKLESDSESDSDSKVHVNCYKSPNPIAFTDPSGNRVAYGIVVDGQPGVDAWWGESWCKIPKPWQRDDLWIEVTAHLLQTFLHTIVRVFYNYTYNYTYFPYYCP